MTGDGHDEGTAEPKTFADKLNRLFEAVHPKGGSPRTNEEVAAGINAQGNGDVTISASYLWLLRTGKRDNPGRAHIQAIARYFGVAPGYFFDDEEARAIEAQLDLLVAMRDAGVKELALRAAGLSPTSLQAITLMVEQARSVERLPTGSEPDSPPPVERPPDAT